MQRITLAVSLLFTVLAPGRVIGAEPAQPAFHHEVERLFDQLTTELRDLGARLEQHFGYGGRPDVGSAAPPSAVERPLITFMLQHRQDLGLSDEQVGRLETLRSNFTREAIRREADIRVAALDLDTLLAQDPLDMPKVEAKVRELAQLQADLRIARLRTIEQGRAVLTPDQRARLMSLAGGARTSSSGPRRPAAIPL